MNDMNDATHTIGNTGSYLITPLYRRSQFRKRFRLEKRHQRFGMEIIPPLLVIIYFLFIITRFLDGLTFYTLFFFFLACLCLILTYTINRCFIAGQRTLAPVAKEIIEKTGFAYFLFHPLNAHDLELPDINFSYYPKFGSNVHCLFSRLYDLAVINAGLCDKYLFARHNYVNDTFNLHRELMTYPQLPLTSINGLSVNQRRYKILLVVNFIIVVALFTFGFAPGNDNSFLGFSLYFANFILAGWVFVMTMAMHTLYKHAFAAAYYYILMDEWPWEKGGR